jgi:hypothetical protein
MSDAELIAELRYLIRREEIKTRIYRDAISVSWMETADADAAVEHALRGVILRVIPRFWDDDTQLEARRAVLG